MAVSFHWHCTASPEAGATWPFWQARVVQLAQEFDVVGHAHPKTWDALGVWYREQGIEATRSFSELLDRCAGGLYVCDNSSTMYEWAGLGWPVLCLNHPDVYRPDVEHGLRFWSHPPGLSTWAPFHQPLGATVEEALADPPEARALRQAAVEEAYGGFFDGHATERAVAALETHLL